MIFDSIAGGILLYPGDAPCGAKDIRLFTNLLVFGKVDGREFYLGSGWKRILFGEFNVQQ